MLACQYMAAILFLASKTAFFLARGFAVPPPRKEVHEMPRGQEVERQELLFPIGDLGPPNGPAGPLVACAGAYDDDEGAKKFQSAMAGLAALFVRVHANAQIASMDTTDE